MSPKFTYEKRYKYPHLLPSDAKLWDRFIAKHPNYFDSVEYDVHVGEGTTIDPDWPDEIAYMAKTLTQRRIDVLGYKGDHIYIVELKVDPGVSVLGQLLAYDTLYLKEHPDIAHTTLVLIANKVDKDLTYILKQHNILYYTV